MKKLWIIYFTVVFLFSCSMYAQAQGNYQGNPERAIKAGLYQKVDEAIENSDTDGLMRIYSAVPFTMRNEIYQYMILKQNQKIIEMLGKQKGK